MKLGRRIEAVVFDLFYTLVHPGTYPGGIGRVGWLARLLGVDPTDLKARWDAFEPVLEAGQAPRHPDGLGPALNRLEVSAAAAAYVGDGSSDELVGARSAGFGMVILAEEAAAKAAPDELPRLRAQADASVTSLTDVVGLVDR
jgi:hypothetical protein